MKGKICGQTQRESMVALRVDGIGSKWDLLILSRVEDHGGDHISAQSLIVEGSGQLKIEFSDLNEPVPIEVEYLPDDPSVSRIKGSGCQSVTEWLWRNVGLGIVLLAMLVAPSIVLFRQGFREIKKVTCRMTLRRSDDSASQ